MTPTQLLGIILWTGACLYGTYAICARKPALGTDYWITTVCMILGIILMHS